MMLRIVSTSTDLPDGWDGTYSQKFIKWYGLHIIMMVNKSVVANNNEDLYE
jgi:hypothetical protein